MAKKVTAKACKAQGKKLVSIKARKFCAGGKKKGKKGGKKSGIAKMTIAARKAMMRKACKNAKPAAKKKMVGLCKWARS
jgi:hypothetical protein